jgi:CDP-glycerol glycerophosphotransferase (TagB/SpsB family)
VLNRIRQLRAVRWLVRRLGVHRVTTVVGLVQAPCVLLLSVLVRRVPRDRRLVALGSPLDRFADNAAYLFLHLSERERGGDSGVRPVWVSGSSAVVQRLRAQGHRAVSRWSPAGVWATVRAGTFVYSGYRSDVNRWLSPGTRTLALWHGIPIKRVEGALGTRGRDRGSLLHRLLDAAREPAPDYLLAPSEFVADRFGPSFGVPPERCLQAGYPRNDHLLRDPLSPPAALVDDPGSWQRLRDARVVVGLFMTWRDDRVDDVVGPDLLEELAALLAREGALLVYKPHFNISGSAVPDEGCVELPPDADLNAYLGLCDVLVTDYSSVSLDFLLMRRPVVYFMPDLEQYGASRGFYIDPLTLPGVVTRTREALREELLKVVSDLDAFDDDRDLDEFLRQHWGPDPAESSAALASWLAGHAATDGSPALSRGPAATPGTPSRRAAG